MKEVVKISVDKALFSSLRKRKKMNKYIETLLKQEVMKNKFQPLLDKLSQGYDLGGFKRDELYDRA